jgi:predicted Na+-dependent transporter
VSDVSAIFVAITTFLAPGGVGSNIFAYMSEGNVA